MPIIRNLTKHVLHLHRVGRVLEPEESVEVSRDEAALLAGHRLIDGVPPAPKPPPAIEFAGQPHDEAAAKSKPAPKEKEGDEK